MIQDIGFYFKLLSRRLPAMMALFVLCSCIGAVMAFRLPTMYATRAVLLVESSQIPNNLARSTIQVGTTEQLEVIQQRLMTRANLIAVARDNSIFANQAAMNPDEIVQQMRQRTRVRLSSGRGKATLMNVSFQDGNPKKVADVVNQYVTIILAENSDFRNARAGNTLDFFEQEVETLSANLEAQNARILEFKSKNADALPDNLNYRQGRQSLLLERLARSERELESLIGQRESMTRLFEQSGTVAVVDGTSSPISPEQVLLNKLEGELRSALSIYSETHPSIRILRTQIADAQERVNAMVLGADGSGDATDGASPQSVALEINLGEIDTQIATVTQDITDVSLELQALQDALERTPGNTLTLDALEREKENIRNLYDSAVGRLAEARMGERIELSSKGERITVLEPASVPNSPSSPNRPKVIAMGVGVGAALAVGFFLLLELLNTKVRRAADITKALNITPLATVPRFETLKDRRRRRIGQIATLAVVLVAVPAALWAVDTFYMPLDALFEKVADRLT